MPHFLSVDGCRLHYQVDDHTDPWRDAPVLVIQHGLLKNSDLAYAWVPYLSRFFKVVRPDLRGHGRSSMASNGPLQAQTLLDDFTALLAHLEVDRVHYCGESLGGILGIMIGARMPERVRSLSLVSTPLFLGAAMKARYALGHADWSAALQAIGLHEWSLRLGAYRFGDAAPSGLMQWQAQQMKQLDLAAILQFIPLVESADVSGEVGRIQAPVLGLYDVANEISGAAAGLLADALPHAQIVKLPTGGHTAFSVLPASCARHVLAFCSAIEGAVFNEM